jgi:hypothetical protein
LTEEGTRSRDRVEERTDEAALQPWEALDDAEAERLLEVSKPFTKTVAKAMFGR